MQPSPSFFPQTKKCLLFITAKLFPLFRTSLEAELFLVIGAIDEMLHTETSSDALA